ncbi:MAG: sulfite exporter TauE/SafE family protein [Clostridiales bacterium]|nr:MAG: sulfite exporter TauE/SafE family protein [Clostridiales bacterium]
MKQRNHQKVWIKILCGLGIGLINGFFGSGGGVLAVECMTRLGEKEKRAHASAILAILPLSIASAVIYCLNGYVPWETEIWMLLAGGAAGGFLGALLLDKLSAGWVNVLFTVLILISGIRMLFA